MQARVPQLTARPREVPLMAQVEALVKRLQRLKTLRQPHEAVWRDCFDHSFPIRGSGLQGGQPMDAQQAWTARPRLLHSAATDAGRTLAAALVSGATPSSSVWGLLDVTGADEAGKRWLDEKAKQLHEEIHASTFDAAAIECALDLVGAGWFALYIDVDREQGGFTFEQWPLSGVYAATTKPGGLVDTVFREYTLTAEQCVREFGIDSAVSADTLKKSQADPDAPVCICHAIYPRMPYVVGAKLAKNLPIASCHFEVARKHLLRESGYHEMPVIVPRWAVIPGSVYAIGPMFDALPDARQLNELMRMDTMNAELAIAGMWIAEDDGVLNPRTVKVGPRKVIVANSVDSMKQLSAGGDWHLADERIAQLHGAIRKHPDGRPAAAAGRPGDDGHRGARARRPHPPAARPDLRTPAGRIPRAAGRALLRPGLPRRPLRHGPAVAGRPEPEGQVQQPAGPRAEDGRRRGHRAAGRQRSPRWPSWASSCRPPPRRWTSSTSTRSCAPPSTAWACR
jgi:hypothetical protein